jgi:outer membrane protein
MKMKKVVCLFVLIILLAGQSVYAEDVKIGFVDIIKALNESETGKKAKADLEFLIKSKQTTIDEKGKKIEKLRSDLEKQASVLSPDAKKLKEEELERLVRDYQRLVTDSQNEVKKKEKEFTDEIIKEIRVIIKKIAEEENYTTIIEKAQGIILYSQKELDLTETVIKRYNESKAKAKE